MDDWLTMLSDGTNDLEAPAIRIQPVIGEVLARLRATGARLSRMSGSGATCFAIFGDETDAHHAAQTIRLDHPQWWVHVGMLG
jgi:4-diphosphocytidyl-2-C-methyl-D-erythritol kinase